MRKNIQLKHDELINLAILSNNTALKTKLEQYVAAFPSKQVHLIDISDYPFDQSLLIVLFTKDMQELLPIDHSSQISYLYLQAPGDGAPSSWNPKIRVEEVISLDSLSTGKFNCSLENLINKKKLMRDLCQQRAVLLEWMESQTPAANDAVLDIIENTIETDEQAVLAENNRLIETISANGQSVSNGSMHDTLTHVPNRYYFETTLDKLLSHGMRHHKIIALLSIDINHFKDINDTHGHHLGDQLLVAVAKRLSCVIRGGDFLARMGGDEFAIVLYDLDNTHGAGIVAYKINNELEKPFTFGDKPISITVSIGISCFPYVGESVEKLLTSANIAMVQAKKTPDIAYIYATLELQEDHLRRLEMEQQLRGALAAKEFSLNYQPIYSTDTQELHSFEVLLRWNNAKLGSVSPEKFIPIAESTGLIRKIGEWILDTSFKQIAAWHAEGIFNHRLSINLSPIQLTQESLLPTIIELIQTYQLPYHLLEFELTEMAIMHQDATTNKTMEGLYELGSTHALDDFGTGYSSISHLQSLPISTLKIDKTFIDSIESLDEANPIVDAIIGLAKKLSLKIVAEGVETELQLKYLQARDCDFVQGYYFSRPLTVEKTRELLLNL